jgi:hypothetical protein
MYKFVTQVLENGPIYFNLTSGRNAWGSHSSVAEGKVFWDVTPCYLASSFQNFEESWCLDIWGQVFLACLIQKMKTMQSFKMPQATHTMTKCHIPEDLNKVFICFAGPCSLLSGRMQI